jgi:hypothetical protein
LYTGVGFFLNGSLFNNNSIMLLSDVGEGRNALHCLTERPTCCGVPTGGANRGIWRYPGGINNVGEVTSADIYFTRGFSSLLLNRRSSAVGPTGVYTCLIPDARNVLRTLSIGLYGADGGELINEHISKVN